LFEEILNKKYVHITIAIAAADRNLELYFLARS
jgi:hypothetical protein